MDVALVCDALVGQSSLAAAARSTKVQEISVGFVDIEKWRLPAHTQHQDPKYFRQTVSTGPNTAFLFSSNYWQAREYAHAKDLLSRHGAKVVDVDITPPEKHMIGGINAEEAISVVIG